MSTRYYAISDIHGQWGAFRSLLQHFNPETDILVLMGDYIDRGSKSIKVLRDIVNLVKLYGTDKVKVLLGNHDKMLLDFIDNPHQKYMHYATSGGIHTLQEVYKMENDSINGYYDLDPAGIRDLCVKLITPQLDFLRNETLLYYETDKLLFTHAGYDTTKEHWTETEDKDFYWIRKHYENAPTTDLINVFGHTRTSLIRKMQVTKPYVTDGFIGIDGGSAYGGKLNGLFLSPDGTILETIAV